MIKRRILALVLTLALALTLFGVTAYADGGDPETFAVDRETGERYGDGETVQLALGGELYLSFLIEPDNPSLLIGWRNDILAAEGFEIDYDPVFFDDVAYAHIKAGNKQVGDVGTLPYSVYRLSDIFGENAVGWAEAVPLYTRSVKIEVVEASQEPAMLLGDSDGDNHVTILDATAIQRHLVGLSTKSFVLLFADADRNGQVEILDATAIQRNIAGLPAFEEIGEEVSYGTYYASWNIGQELLPATSTLTGADAEYAREEIRRALALLVDRGWITREAVPVKRLPASTFVSKWITDADGTEFHQNAGLGGGKGYFDADSYTSNVEKAVEILKKYYRYDAESKKFTDVPKLSFVHNNGTVHAAIANKIKNDFAAVGIELTVNSTDWNNYLETIDAGSYSLARSGWVVDHDDPLEFLELWTSGCEDNMIGFGKKELFANAYSIDLNPFGIDYKIENGTWQETYDILIAKIRECEDPTVKYQLLHLAEDMVMATGCVMPLYYY